MTDVNTLLTLETRQVATEARLDALTKDIEGLTGAVSNLAEIIRSGSRTPWNNIIAAVGVSFAILSAIFSLMISNQASNVSRLESAILKTVEWERNHAQKQAALEQRVDDAIKKLDEVATWQRNNNTINTADIAALKERLKSIDASREAAHTRVDRRLDQLEKR